MKSSLRKNFDLEDFLILVFLTHFRPIVPCHTPRKLQKPLFF